MALRHNVLQGANGGMGILTSAENQVRRFSGFQSLHAPLQNFFGSLAPFHVLHGFCGKWHGDAVRAGLRNWISENLEN